MDSVSSVESARLAAAVKAVSSEDRVSQDWYSFLHHPLPTKLSVGLQSRLLSSGVESGPDPDTSVESSVDLDLVSVS